MATGHDSTPTRHYGAQTVNTTFVEPGNRPLGSYVTLQFDCAAADVALQQMAPCDGKVVAAYVTSATNTDDSNVVDVDIFNDTTSKTIVTNHYCNANLNTLTANTIDACTIDTTAANVAVTRGDVINVNYDETGTIAGVQVSVVIEQVE